MWLISCLKYTEAATEFAFSLLQTLLIEERGVISEFPNLIDAMAKVFFFQLFCVMHAFNSSSTF